MPTRCHVLSFLLCLAVVSLAAPGRGQDALRRGLTQFEAGRYEQALVELDRAVLERPAIEPQLWQRGICQYYAGKFDAGRRQFVRHREVNGDDVENSVWHYLCTARQSGLARARREWMEIPERVGGFPDRRVPMRQVHELFAGRGKPEDLLAAAAAVPEGMQRRAFFYAHLYLGLWYEIQGRPFDSLREMRRCVEDHGVPGAMGDVAREHLRRRDPRRKEG